MNGVFSVVMAVCYMLDPISLLAGFPSVHTRRRRHPTPLVEQARVARPAEEIHFLLPLSWPRYEAEPFPGNDRNRGGRPLFPFPNRFILPLTLLQKQNKRGLFDHIEVLVEQMWEV